MKRRIFAALCAMVMILAMALPVSASSVLDQNAKGSLSLTMTSKGNPVPGGSVSIYHVASIREENGKFSFSYINGFEPCIVSLDGDLTSPTAANGIALFAASNPKTVTAPVKQNIDQYGKVTFSNLAVGLYLVVQYDNAPGYSNMKPFLISIPQESNGILDYSVDAAPKMGEIVPETKPPVPAPPPPPKPTGKLPQTGQLNWPVPVLAICGLILFTFGWWMNASAKRRKYESDIW